METFVYTDLFATKGIEYLLVIGFLICFVVFWTFLNRSHKPEPAPSLAGGPVPPRRWFHLPEGLFCHQGHTWARPEAEDVVEVGIDDFAQRLLGRPTSVRLPRVGETVEQGGNGWELQFDSKSIDLLAPVGGEVLAVNEEVLRSPALINQDPYGQGWLLKVRVPTMHANLKNLLSGKLAQAWMEQTVQALRQRVARNVGTVLQDGGVPVEGIARNLSPESWDEIARDFLLTRES